MTYFLKDYAKKVLKIYKSIAIENFKPGTFILNVLSEYSIDFAYFSIVLATKNVFSFT